MYQGMKSVMVFDPKDSEEETENKWVEWSHHKSNETTENLSMMEELKEN